MCWRMSRSRTLSLWKSNKQNGHPGGCPFQIAEKAPPNSVSSRTSPQTGVAIPKVEGKTSDYELKMFENSGDCQKVNCPKGQERPPWGAPVCALARNDMVFRQAQTDTREGVRFRYFCWRKIDIFPGGNSIYRVAIRYDINPLSPRRAYRVVTHIEGEAYIENPLGIYIESHTSMITGRIMGLRLVVL